MRKKGQITVFLSLILLCIVSLLCGLFESARLAGSRYYLKTAADSAMDSVFSGYHRDAWETYRLFFLEYEKEEDLTDSWESFLKPYLDDSGWYPIREENVEIIRVDRVTDDHGTHLKQEILDYMKFGVWDVDQDEVHAGELLKNLKEAGAVGEISKRYAGHAREAVKLEKALDAIEKSLDRQQEYWQEAKAALGGWDGSKFRSAAKEYENEAKRLPNLVKTYEKRADELAHHLEEARSQMTDQKKELSDLTNQALEAEIDSFWEYTAQDGAKRLEIEALKDQTMSNLPLADQAIDRSYEVEEELDEWEDSASEESDEPDEGALWNCVEAVWDRIRLSRLSFTVGIRDEQKQKFLEEVKGMANFGILELMLPEGTEVSRSTLPRQSLPSQQQKDGRELEYGLVDQLLTDEYCHRFFTNFLSDERNELQYEQEYLVGGKDTDEGNLEQAIAELLLIREGMNLIHIVTDSVKREEAKALAGLIAGITGAAPLTGIVAFFIMSVWALGEAFVDVKALLEGKKTAFVKSRETWNLSLEGLLDLGRTGSLSGGMDCANGLNYDEYLKLLFFAGSYERLLYRIMDVIQINIGRNQNGFAMDQCACGLEIQAKSRGKHIFFSGGVQSYPMTVQVEKFY